MDCSKSQQSERIGISMEYRVRSLMRLRRDNVAHTSCQWSSDLSCRVSLLIILAGVLNACMNSQVCKAGDKGGNGLFLCTGKGLLSLLCLSKGIIFSTYIEHRPRTSYTVHSKTSPFPLSHSPACIGILADLCSCHTDTGCKQDVPFRTIS